jgi:eukaryotic-like serine/threonine-protein kinase
MENHQIGDLVDYRYRIVKVLGQGGIGITYQAGDINTQQQVALKVLSFRGMSNWKILEMFEREARVLANLNHPAIPKYIDYFQVDTESDRQFYIAQQLAEGKSLESLIASGWRGSEAEIKDIAAQILEILIYLHELQPPVIHRDIKPQNLIRRSDRMITLVDFGAVQDTYRHTQISSSTVVGTYGYMAPEQYRGKALPVSDLFGLGTTLLFLLTGRSPADLPEIRMKIDFRRAVSISQGFAKWLEQMLEPASEDRFSSARTGLEALKNCDVSTNFNQDLDQVKSGAIAKPKSKPFNSRVKLTISSSGEGDRLEVLIPPSGWTAELIPLIIFALFWNAFLVVWTTGAAMVSIFFALFAIPFWLVGLAMVAGVVKAIAENMLLVITPTIFEIRRSIWGFNFREGGNTDDLQKVELGSDTTVDDKPVPEIMFRHGVKTLKFGVNLTLIEKEWLQEEISNFLSGKK